MSATPEEQQRFLSLVRIAARGVAVEAGMAAIQAMGDKDSFKGIAALVGHLAASRILETSLLKAMARHQTHGRQLEEIASEIVRELAKEFDR